MAPSAVIMSTGLAQSIAHLRRAHLCLKEQTCSARTCHRVSQHQIPGKGIDLRVSEGGPLKACADGCHLPRAAQSSRPGHAIPTASPARRCHIPVFGKDVAHRDVTRLDQPAWNPAGCNGQGAWVGEEVKGELNVIPQVHASGMARALFTILRNPSARTRTGLTRWRRRTAPSVAPAANCIP